MSTTPKQSRKKNGAAVSLKNALLEQLGRRCPTRKEQTMEGNQMKMREVIKALLDVLYGMGIDEETVAISAKATNFHMNSCEVLEIIRNAKSALAAPDRNCDIGTVDEQIARHYRYCSCRLGDGDNPHGCGHISCSECVIRWEQMEYKEEARQ